MKKLFYFLLIPVLASMTLLSSCGKDDDNITPDDTEPGQEEPTYDVELIMAEGDDDAEESASVTADQGTVSARIYLTSTDVSMRRMYITQNIGGAGETDYEIDADVDKKSDGSIDVVAAKSNEIEYVIDLPVPSGISEGTVTYKVWTTSGRGDYRDTEKNLAVGVGTITLNYGGTNPDAEVKSYTETLLAAPLADGSSESFVSLKNGDLYEINQGEEFAAFWDFGYFYSAASTGSYEASLASTSNYEAAFASDAGAIVKVSELAGTTDLNNCYFAVSTKTVADFDAIATAGDLEDISKSSEEVATNLVADNIIEFVDNYGKKGLIKVVEVKGTYNSGDYIKIEIKVQP